MGYARLLDLLAGGDLRLLGFGVAQRALAGELRALDRATHLDVAFLIKARGFAFTVDLQGLLLGLEIAAADQDHRVLLDVVAQLAPRFDVLDQFGQALGIEAVRRIEKLEIGLVEIGDRHRFELEAVLLEALERRLLDPVDVFAAPLVHFHHGHFRCDRPQGGDELARQQHIEFGRVGGASAQGRGGDRHRLPGRRHADVELRLDVDPHAVLGDERFIAVANDPHAQDVHVDRRDFVNER